MTAIFPSATPVPSSVHNRQHAGAASTLSDQNTISHIDPPTLYVIKRSGQGVVFDRSKISLAISKACVAVEGNQATASARMRDAIENISREIQLRLEQRLPAGGTIHIEEIQDLVELGLMRQGWQKVARAYVLYREAQQQKRKLEQARSTISPTEEPDLFLNTDEGKQQSISWRRIDEILAWACGPWPEADLKLVHQAVARTVYSGMRARDLGLALVMAVRPLIEKDPCYSQVCAQLLLHKIWQDLSQVISETIANEPQAADYSLVFTAALQLAVEGGQLNPALLEFDLPRLAAALQPERDRQFGYLGLQTLYDRYFLHRDQVRLELPQCFFMRIAMGLALNEEDRNARAIEFYQLLSSFDYMASTPTLFNSGTQRSQLSSCYLTTVPDHLEGIYTAISDNAMLSKWAGGLGNDWTPVRAMGSHIRGTNGESQGVVPFLKVVNDTAVAVNQGGKRKGAVCAYLETWHLDIEEFLELRKNTGDERRRTHDMNTANWVPDLFMQRVFEDAQWTLFSPDEVADLHELYGQAFQQRYEFYEAEAEAGRIRRFRQISATQLWRKMLSMLFETGHPWITFKDPCNLRSPQQHRGVVHSSNLCTEITLNTSADEIAVCNLGSINLARHIREGQLDLPHLEQTIRTAVRMLDNVIDLNYYAVDKARRANLQHRPVGLGLMGFQDALYALGIPYASADAVHFADHSMEWISYFAIRASAELAQERGAYPSFSGSLWSQGVLPIDSLSRLAAERASEYCSFDTHSSLDWGGVRELVVKTGMRNSNVMAIAPTATISNIVGVSQSIEPQYQNLYVKSNLSGEFTVVNPSLVDALKERQLWDELMISDLKYYDGSVHAIERIPQEIKQLFATAFEIDPRWLVEAAARRQKWLDQAQSLNLYMAEASGKKLDNLYKMAWSRGLKTTYYLRSLGATHAEKSGERERVHSIGEFAVAEPQAAACALDNPDCEACQ